MPVVAEGRPSGYRRIKWFDAGHAVLDLQGPVIAIVSAGTWN